MEKIDHNKIIKIISETIREPIEKINMESKASDFVYWDSLSQVTMMLKIEKIIKKKINTSKILELDSVKKIISFLESV